MRDDAALATILSARQGCKASRPTSAATPRTATRASAHLTHYAAQSLDEHVAREHGADLGEEEFNEVLRKVGAKR